MPLSFLLVSLLFLLIKPFAFAEVLAKAHSQINTASGTLDKLRTTRTNVINRKLKDVENITAIESKEIFELPEEDIIDEVVDE